LSAQRRQHLSYALAKPALRRTIRYLH